jgi:single-stranded DNA-specific DHH superfamily exonuclease
MKQNEARAFRKWANTNFKIAEAKLRNELKQKEDQRKNIQRQAKQEAEQQASERQNMTKALQ